MEERLGVIDHYTKKLKSSGYNQNQCKELVKSGVVGYKNKIKNRRKNGQPFYRSAKSTLGGRIRKKLTEKNNWYKKKNSEGQMGAFRGLNANGRPDRRQNHGAKASNPASSASSDSTSSTASMPDLPSNVSQINQRDGARVVLRDGARAIGQDTGDTASLPDLPADAKEQPESETRPEWRKRKRGESDSEEIGERMSCKEMVMRSPAKKIKTGRVEKTVKQKDMKAKTVIFVPHTAQQLIACWQRCLGRRRQPWRR